MKSSINNVDSLIRANPALLAFLMAIATVSFMLYIIVSMENPLYHDDAFISLTYARNLARGNGLVFNMGEYVWGYTSPLHVLVLGLLGLFFENIPLVAVIIGVISCGLFSLVFYLILRRVVQGYYAFLAFLLLLANAYNYGFLGLETNLLILTQAGFVYLALFGVPVSAGVLAAMSCLLRPDSIIFCMPILMLSNRLRSYKVLIAFAVPGILWVLFTLLYYHDWLPQTFHAKQGLSDLQTFLLVALPGISKINNLWQQHDPYFWAVINVLITLGCLLHAKIRSSYILIYVFLIYPWVLISAYALIGSPPGHSWEYRSAMVFNAVALSLGLLSIIESFIKSILVVLARDKNVVRLISRCVLIIGVLVLTLIGMDKQVSRLNEEQTAYWWGGRHETYVAVAKWLRANVPPDSKILYGEPGTIAYYSDLFISDNFLISRVGVDKVDYVIRQGDVEEWAEAGFQFYRVKYFGKDKFEAISILKRKL